MPAAPAPDALAEELGLIPEAVEQLTVEAERIVTQHELPSVQLALARDGKVALELTFGLAQTSRGPIPATNDTLYQGFSTTKALIASAIWLLVEERRVDVSEPVARWIPEFADNGKEGVLIEQLLTHTAGFPFASFRAQDWNDPEQRLHRFANWKLEWEPGSRFTYHAASSLWVVAEIIERCARTDFREFIRSRILTPLQLENFHLGLPSHLEHRVADVVWVGKPRSTKVQTENIVQPPVNEASEETLTALYNSHEYHAIGVPGGGGIMTSGNLALFYQGLLHGGARGCDPIWSQQTIAWAREVRTGDLIDPMTGKPANRGLGIVVAGDEDRLFRGFAQHNSADAFGHLGMGGQVGWADPTTGLSFAFLTNGHERNPLRAGVRAMGMSERAVACIAS